MVSLDASKTDTCSITRALSSAEALDLVKSRTARAAQLATTNLGIA
jgi:hypothetical protein